MLPIDLVVVNLYPFEATAAKPDLTPEELIENIDIGGPTMVRSAAKNFESVAVVTDPADYAAILAELPRYARSESRDAARSSRARRYARTARYDGKIATELERLAANGERRPSAAREVARAHCTSLERRQDALR